MTIPQVRQPPWRDLSLLLLFCLVIAVFLQLIRGNGLIHNLVFSESIGISIYSSIKALIRLRHSSKDDFVSCLVGIPLGGFAGVVIGAVLTGANPLLLFSTKFDKQQKELLIPALAAIVFGVAIAWFFHSREKMARQKLQLQQEASRRSEKEKNLVETQLRLLQAQIEPHFLFNSLANVVSLIDHEPENAKRVLENLSDFLRTSLLRTRQEATTVRDEINLLTAYLYIQRARMGQRLQYHIECPEALMALPLPPLLVQPLVENALKHGLENEVGGGCIHISLAQKDQALIIQVSDTGRGFQNDGEAGIGLANVRHRLRGLYDNAGLSLYENETGGVMAQLALPLTIEQIPENTS